jgi:hypothetical protein
MAAPPTSTVFSTFCATAVVKAKADTNKKEIIFINFDFKRLLFFVYSYIYGTKLYLVLPL